MYHDVRPDCRDFDHFLRRMDQAGYEIRQGKYLSFRAPGQQRFTRAKTLGDDYAEEAIRLKISGSVTQQTAGKEAPSTRTDISSLIDIQKKLSEGKGAPTRFIRRTGRQRIRIRFTKSTVPTSRSTKQPRERLMNPV